MSAVQISSFSDIYNNVSTSNVTLNLANDVELVMNNLTYEGGT